MEKKVAFFPSSKFHLSLRDMEDEADGHVKLVSMDLCEVRGWWNVEIHQCKELNLSFISGHPSRHEPREIILPLHSSHVVTQDILQTYLQTIKLDDQRCADGITLAICDTDSTTVYYKITSGLVPPDSPELSDYKKQQRILKFRNKKQNINHCLDSYIERKNQQSNQDQTENKTKEGER